MLYCETAKQIFGALGAPKGAPLEASREAGADVGEARHALEALIAVYRETP